MREDRGIEGIEHQCRQSGDAKILRFLPQSRTWTVLTLIALTLLNYLVFPVAFDYLRPSKIFPWIVFTKDVALFAMLWLILSRESDSSSCARSPGSTRSPTPIR